MLPNFNSVPAIFIGIIFFTMCCLSQQTNIGQDDPKEILQKAFAAFNSFTSFHAESEVEVKGRIARTTTYYKKKSDGQILIRQTAKSFKGKIQDPIAMDNIVNSDGSWTIIGNSAINSAYDNPLRQSIETKLLGLKGQVIPDDRYEIFDTNFNKTACYLIKDTYSEAIHEQFRQGLNTPESKEYAKSINAEISFLIPTYSVYIIEKKRLIIYSKQIFNNSGRIISDDTYNNVEINTDIPDSTFSIPVDVQRYTARSAIEFSHIVEDVVGKTVGINNVSSTALHQEINKKSKKIMFVILIVALNAFLLFIFYYFRYSQFCRGRQAEKQPTKTQ